MSLAVHISPSAREITPDNGIGQVVHHMARLLPALGIELVDDPARADVTACHIESQGRPVDVQHVHGLYFDDMPHAPYDRWHHEANRRIAETARQARAITVPSAWVRMPFLRDMRITPEVIGHGVNLADWQPVPIEQRKGYALWNKNRGGDVCDPRPAMAVAKAGMPVLATFGPAGEAHPMFYAAGAKPHAEMTRLIRYASVYLATTCETFGIGTLEALAAGVPVVGYRWGGTAELVQDGVSGFLVEPGDERALIGKVALLLSDPTLQDTMGTYARERAAMFTWEAAAETYAALYRRVAEEKAAERHRVAVVVTSYNYGRYLDGAVQSLLKQTNLPDEIIIVNDGSTDSTAEVAQQFAQESTSLPYVRYIDQPNQGVASARNNGIAAADAEYIVCLDADDELAPDYLRICREALRADRGLGIAYTGVGLLEAQGVRPAWATPFDWELQATPGNPPPTCVPTAAMFRRSLWERAGGYRQIHAPGEDAEFYTRGLSIGYSARLVATEPWIRYRNHGAGAHLTKPYAAIDPYYPWIHDKRYPLAAPAARPVPVRSYHQPLISVIIPCGPGHQRYLSAALDSLLQQRYRNWEAVVIDDTGDAGAVRAALTSYPFVRYIKLFDGRGRMGPGAARNAGVKAATAPLIVFLDADDWLTRADALDRMLAAHAETGSYVYTDWISSHDMQIHAAPEYSQQAWLERGQHAVTALIPTPWARETPFNETLKGWEDWQFYIDLALKGHCGHRLAEPFLGYRFDSGTQRETAWANRDRLLPQLQAYVRGKTPMACGCSNYVRVLRSIEEELAMTDLPLGASVQDGQTLMEFTGHPNAGTARVNSRSVRDPDTNKLVRYEYGGGVRFFPVWNADVAFMESLGDFRVAGIAAAAAQEPLGAFLPSAASNDTAPAPSVNQVPVPSAVEPVRSVEPFAISDDAPVVDAAALEAGMADLLAQAEAAAADKAKKAAATVRRRRQQGG